MSRILFLSVCWGLFTAGIGTAQDVISHTVNFPKGDAAWKVTYERPDSGDKSPDSQEKPDQKTKDQKKELDVIRKGNMRHDTLVLSDGTNTEYWWDSALGLVLYQHAEQGPIISGRSVDKSSWLFDESFFNWISADNFKGMKTCQGKKCRYYELRNRSYDYKPQVMQAWIENATGKPVGYHCSNGDIYGVFSFDVPLPEEPLIVPENYKKEFAHTQDFFVFPRRVTSTPKQTPSTLNTAPPPSQ